MSTARRQPRKGTLRNKIWNEALANTKKLEESTKEYWLNRRGQHEMALVNLALRTKKKTPTFVRQLAAINKILEQCTEALKAFK